MTHIRTFELDDIEYNVEFNTCDGFPTTVMKISKVGNPSEIISEKIKQRLIVKAEKYASNEAIGFMN